MMTYYVRYGMTRFCGLLLGYDCFVIFIAILVLGYLYCELYYHLYKDDYFFFKLILDL